MATEDDSPDLIDGGVKMKHFLGVFAIVLLTVPAYAQGTSEGKRRPMSDQRSDELRKKRTDASEKAHPSTLDTSPNNTYDPWRNMREPPRAK
jgi:hypothetical protein